MLDAHQRSHIHSNKALVGSSLRRKRELFPSAEGRVTEKTHFDTDTSKLSRKKSLFALGGEYIEENKIIPQHQYSEWFGPDIRFGTEDLSERPSIDSKILRTAMEPHLRKARLDRMESRDEEHLHKVIGSSAGVPYVSLREERPFLFDTHSYPMHEILAQTLGVHDLSKLHESAVRDKQKLFAPLLEPASRRHFHKCYDKFVTTFIIPLLHSFALRHDLLRNTSASPTASSKIVYRYQAFPCIRVVRPGECSTPPHCDVADGHSIGNLNFHVPLTPAFGTNSLYTESLVGREDWHPLTTKSVGLGYLFDGARSIHFGLENTTSVTRVSIDFRVAIYREDYSNSCLEGGGLCSCEMLQDKFSSSPGYYDEAIVETGLRSISCMQQFVAKKKNPNRLLKPDARVGFPFA